MLETETLMTQLLLPPHRRIGLLLLAASLAFAAGCASQPKPIAAVETGNQNQSEAAPPTKPSPQTAATQSAPLPPIAPAQNVENREVRGVVAQASAGDQETRVADTLGQAGDRVYFMTDRYDLTDEARATLARQAAWILANPSKRVIIAGSADERGTREYNLALGSRRAAATRDYLVGLGVNAENIETVSYGKERPIDPRSNPEGWAINRNSITQLLD
jgi:peptidoglycan-associated lipoprotein